MGKKRITVDLDEDMLTALDSAASYESASRNGFVADAIRRAIVDVEERRIDEAFDRMGQDSDYQAILARTGREWDGASDAAWKQLDAAEGTDRWPQ